jgi:hypothetical protein
MQKKIFIAVLSLILIGCASNKPPLIKSNTCLSFIVSGDNVEWRPIKFSRSENSLYIQIPSYIKFIPDLNVIDTDFDQTESVKYTFNSKTNTYRVDDNYAKYVLSRTSDDNSDDKTVYITCKR